MRSSDSRSVGRHCFTQLMKIQLNETLWQSAKNATHESESFKDVTSQTKWSNFLGHPVG